MSFPTMDTITDVMTVTDLRRGVTQVINDIHVHRLCKIITQRGRPAAVFIDIVSFQEQQERLFLLEKIVTAEKAVEEGRVISQAEAAQSLQGWLGSHA